MCRLLLLLIGISTGIQGSMDKFYNYLLLGPNTMQEAKSLFHSSRELKDYDALRQKLFAQQAPWYVRMFKLFEPNEEKRLKQLWQQVYDQFKCIEMLKNELHKVKNNDLLARIAGAMNKAYVLEMQTAGMLSTAGVGYLSTKRDARIKSKLLLGEILDELLRMYNNFSDTIAAVSVSENEQPVFVCMQTAARRGLSAVTEIKKAYDRIDISAVDLWYIMLVDKQLVKYWTKLQNTVTVITKSGWVTLP